ncbi:hypothetical protein [Merdimonas faecis]|nr:hypothetical protein [Merdimonas faecis]
MHRRTGVAMQTCLQMDAPGGCIGRTPSSAMERSEIKLGHGVK